MAEMESKDKGEIREITHGRIVGKMAMCMGCAKLVGVSQSVVEYDGPAGAVCIMCHRPEDDMRTLPVDADFNKWVPKRDGPWNAPPWYLNPKINSSIVLEDPPTGQMLVWIQMLDIREVEIDYG
jgi:hypothetical protein